MKPPIPHLLAALLGVAVGAYGEHLISAREMSDMRADAAKAQTKAAEAARAEEQRRTEAQREIATDANQQRIVALADAFAARAAAGSLQQRVDQLVAAARHPAAAAGSPSAADALDLLADVFGRSDETSGELAKIADDRGIAGKQCERDYDALTSTTRK